MKYTGEIEGQYGSREDPKKLALIQEFPGNTGEFVTLSGGKTWLGYDDADHSPHPVLRSRKSRCCTPCS
jgi:hypothetical protein